MSFSSDVSQELVEAMRAKDGVRVSTLRLLIAALKNKQIELGHELSMEESADVVAKAAKQRKESIEAYKSGGREDLVKKEEAELEILAKYLPEQMSQAEVEKVIGEVIAQMGTVTIGDTGKVIGQVMGRLKGKADGNVVSQLVREKLK